MTTAARRLFCPWFIAILACLLIAVFPQPLFTHEPSSSVCALALWVAALASGNLDQPNAPTFWVACFVLWFVIAFVLQAAFLWGVTHGGGE